MNEGGPDFRDLQTGDLVKVRVGNERLWFAYLAHIDSPPNAILATLRSTPATGVAFDGRVTLDRDWIIETHRPAARPTLKVVSS